MTRRSRRGAAMVLDPWRTPARFAAPPLVNGAGAVGDPSRAGAEDELAAGQELGRYQIVEQIGEGGMGRIYAARDTRHGRKVALKVLARALALDDGLRRERLEREARALASVRHPNVVELLDFCEVGGDAFTVMEYLDGTTLRELVRQAPLPHGRCLAVTAQVVAGLAAIHDAGIVHRDLKPDNVQLLSCGRVKILDLGLSIRIDPADGVGRGRRRGRALEELSGTPPYIAPEMLRGGRADYRSDIFAFGVMLHEMLTGELPVGVCASSTGGSRLERTARRCRKVRPEERYASARELSDALAAAASSEDAGDGLSL